MDLRNSIRSSARFAANLLPLEILTAMTRVRVILPFYHAISDQPPPHLRHVLKTRSVNTFQNDLETLLRHFEPVDAYTLKALASGETTLPRPAFHLSFDDGLKEAVTIIAPILKEKGIPASFFINTGFIDNRDLFYRFKVSVLISTLEDKKMGTVPDSPAMKKAGELLENHGIKAPSLREQLLAVDYLHKEILSEAAHILGVDFDKYLLNQEVYMNETDIQSLIDDGFSIGGHSYDHPEFKLISAGEQLSQALDSTQWIKERFNFPLSLFSFPFSDEKVPATFFHSIYPPEGEIDLTFGISGLKKEEFPRHHHRIPMERGALSAREIIGEEFFYYLLKAPFGKNKIVRP